MQKLTAMTIGAFLIGLCGYAVDASAQTAPKCPTHEATIFFAPESSELNKFSSYTVNEMAEAARACGSKGVIVQVPTDNERAGVVATILRSKGVKAVIVPAPTLVADNAGMMSRAVVLRVSAPGSRTS